MPKPKRATVPENTFINPTTSALNRLTAPAPVAPVGEEEGPEKEKLIKMSIYVTAKQITKLGDLAKGKRLAIGDTTNQMDVIRTLIDRAELETIM